MPQIVGRAQAASDGNVTATFNISNVTYTFTCKIDPAATPWNVPEATLNYQDVTKLVGQDFVFAGIIKPSKVFFGVTSGEISGDMEKPWPKGEIHANGANGKWAH
ncbi:hypothetical protein GYMLUDRAFT_82414 [Collybiopsis luxurians FD-317 M1]|nr:hypothetical protein GYMLUDRAFT_82414 [Collybiopsis luxurians FD-317 M1]